MVSCPICQSVKTQKYFSDKTLTLFRCSLCGVKFQHPMPALEFLSQVYSSSYYDSFYPDKVLGEQKLLFNDHLRLLEHYLGDKKGKLLDVGAGRGMFLKAALERGWECVGQEFSNEAAKALRERLGIEVVVCKELVEAQFPSQNFDLVNLNHVLEHLYEPESTLSEIFRILKSGGLLFCEVPRQRNALNLLSRIFGKKDFSFGYHSEHLFVFDIPTIDFLLKRSGLEILSIKIASIGDAHRFVHGVHYNSWWTRIIVKIVGGFKLQVPLGGGNLMAIARKPI